MAGRHDWSSGESIRARLNSTDGSATLQFVVLAPVLIIATFTLVQAVLFFMANTAVTNGAQLALESARAETSTAQDGQAIASSYLAGQGMVTNPSVSVERSADQVVVTTTGTVPSLVPFLQLPAARSHITGPVERVVAP